MIYIYIYIYVLYLIYIHNMYIYIYIYICIYTYAFKFNISILKSFHNVFHKKIILKLHLFIKNISRSLHIKNLSKHQTKINTAINTT